MAIDLRYREREEIWTRGVMANSGDCLVGMSSLRVTLLRRGANGQINFGLLRSRVDLKFDEVNVLGGTWARDMRDL